MIQTINPGHPDFTTAFVKMLRDLAGAVEKGDLVYKHGDLAVTVYDQTGNVRMYGDLLLYRRHQFESDVIDVTFKEVDPPMLRHEP